MYSTRRHGPKLNIEHISTGLTIESPQTNIGYYWCQVNNPSYNGVFISSNKAPVFDIGTMTICNGWQHVTMTTCAIISNINTPSLPCALYQINSKQILIMA